MAKLHILIDSDEIGGRASFAHGQLLRLLAEAGIGQNDYTFQHLTPPAREAELFCKKTELTQGTTPILLQHGKYLASKYVENFLLIQQELPQVQANLILALGSIANAALTSVPLSSIRGTIFSSASHKCLSSHAPAMLAKNWSMRPVILADILKAKSEMEFPDIKRARRELWIYPDIDGLVSATSRLTQASAIGVDIETSNGQITCIGFSASQDFAIVCPFVCRERAEYSYWPTPADEAFAWRWVKSICQLPNPKVLQNGLYDIQWLWRKAGITLAGEIHDTMLLHHALQPEMEKGLGFLGSIYANESSWKIMRKPTSTKKDE
jgi:uracil-DNA glycosylase